MDRRLRMTQLPLGLGTEIVQSFQPSILVVDDEPTVRGLVVHWLHSAGYSCKEAADADEALEILRSNVITLVTLDVTLPGLSGLELLKLIKSEFPDTEVLMLTGLGQAETAIAALTHGAAAYLIKPIAREELQIQTRKALELRQLVLNQRRYTEHLEMQVRKQTISLRKAHEQTIHRLVTVSMYRDEETGAHIRRVGAYSAVMSEVLGWSADEVDRIRLAAPMHDIGKIGIPDSILRKAGTLTADEYETMKQHTTIGATMLAGSNSPVLELGRIIALGHHERWDGRGYPYGLVGESIPVAARIVSIVDVYDALTHERVYRPAFPEDEAVAILEKGRGTHFDPVLLDLFITLLPKMRRIAREIPDDALEVDTLQEHFPNLEFDEVKRKTGFLEASRNSS